MKKKGRFQDDKPLNPTGEKIVNHLKNLSWVKSINEHGFFGAFWLELKDVDTQKMLMLCFLVGFGMFYTGARVNCEQLGGLFVVDKLGGLMWSCYDYDLIEYQFNFNQFDTPINLSEYNFTTFIIK
jgi:hypothetical protein